MNKALELLEKSLQNLTKQYEEQCDLWEQRFEEAKRLDAQSDVTYKEIQEIERAIKLLEDKEAFPNSNKPVKTKTKKT